MLVFDKSLGDTRSIWIGMMHDLRIWYFDVAVLPGNSCEYKNVLPSMIQRLGHPVAEYLLMFFSCLRPVGRYIALSRMGGVLSILSLSCTFSPNVLF